MKAVFAAGLCVLFLASCGQYVPVQGIYQKGPFSIDTQKSKDEIWENLMDLVTRNALPVTLLDKASGVLMVGPTAIEITRELGAHDRDGQRRPADNAPELRSKEAAGVSGYTYQNGSFSYPKTGLTRWNVRVRDGGDSRTVSVVLYGQRTAAGDAFEQARGMPTLRPTKSLSGNRESLKECPILWYLTSQIDFHAGFRVRRCDKSGLFATSIALAGR